MQPPHLHALKPSSEHPANQRWHSEIIRLAPILPNESPLSWNHHQSWQLWGKTRLRGQLLPALSDCQILAEHNDIHSLLGLAQHQANQWSEAEQQRSLNAGRHLLQSSHGARGHDAYLQLRDRWLSQNDPTWYHAVLAARASFLHLPLTTLVTAYSWREWRSHQPSIAPGQEHSAIQQFDHQAGPTVASSIRCHLSQTLLH